MKKISALLILAALFTAITISAANAEYTMEGTGIVSGLVDTVEGEYYIILGIFKGSPAAGKNLKVGDKITAINGNARKAMTGTYLIDKDLNPKAGTSVSITVERKGKSITQTLTSAKIKITQSKIPSYKIPDGRIKELKPTGSGICTYTSGRNVRQGDHFFVFDSGECVGTARIYNLNSSGSTVRVETRDRKVKKNFESLKGAKMVFYKPTNQSTHVRNSFRKWPMALPTPKLDPLYVKYSKRKDLTGIRGEVMVHNKVKKTITLKHVTSISSSPAGGNTLVTTRYEVVTIHYANNVSKIPSNALSKIGYGDIVGIFFKKQGKQMNAKLIHLLKDK